jgi:hypothetical protein
MSVVSQILDDMVWSRKRLLDIGNPFFVLEHQGKAVEGLSVLKMFECSCEPKFAPLKDSTQQREKLATTHGSECLHGQKELEIPARDPACLVKRDTARRHEAMDMGMRKEFLIQVCRTARLFHVHPATVSRLLTRARVRCA